MARSLCALAYLTDVSTYIAAANSGYIRLSAYIDELMRRAKWPIHNPIRGESGLVFDLTGVVESVVMHDS